MTAEATKHETVVDTDPMASESSRSQMSPDLTSDTAEAGSGLTSDPDVIEPPTPPLFKSTNCESVSYEHFL